MNARFRTFLALALGVVTVAAAEKAATYQTGAQWLVVVAIATAFVVALCAAAAAVVVGTAATVRYALYERRLAARIAESAPPPSARHARPAPLTQRPPEVDPRTATRDGRLVDYYGDDALTEARVAAAEAERAVRDEPTQPMPLLDDAAVLPVRTTQYAASGAQWGRT